MSSVTLILLDSIPVDFSWSLGKVYAVEPTPEALATLFEDQLANSAPTAYLFWDISLGEPDAAIIQQLLAQPHVDIWHAGLRLGLQGKPDFLDFVKPTWLLSCDADPEIVSSSWRLSLCACLIRTSVLQQMGGPDPLFQSLEMAGLEMGHRYVQYGVIMRHTPQLTPFTVQVPGINPALEDEVRFIHKRYSRQLTYWGLARALMTFYVTPLRLWQAANQVFKSSSALTYDAYAPNQINIDEVQLKETAYRVTVLIATLDRYPYLRKLLDQLHNQTVAPYEVLVIDQTPAAGRDLQLDADFADLPLRVIYLDEPGQCLSRNVGLQAARGDYVLFMDDDVEIEADLIERHLKNLAHFSADTSSGRIEEAGALPLTGGFTRTRLSDVCPAGNTMIRKDVLFKSGLFDMAFQRRQSEDGDLGIRIHLTGALMIYNPQISLMHLRAPSGGLRTHGARVVTYSSSRQRLFHRRFPHVSEVYLQKRYFTARQVRESAWMSLFGTFVIRGSIVRKLLKIIIALALLPDTYLKLRHRHSEADKLMRDFPQIPHLHPPDVANGH